MSQAPPVGLNDLKGSPKRIRRERAFKGLFFGAAFLSILISAAIVVSLFGEALTFLRNVDLSALIDPEEGWFPRRGRFDVITLITGTLVVSLIAMVVATPLGLGASLYLSEYAKPRVRRALKPILEILASIPSVVLGYFALAWISPNFMQALCNQPTSFNLGAAGIAVGILITPLVASVAEDSFRSVPMALREASYGMGAREADDRFQHCVSCSRFRGGGFTDSRLFTGGRRDDGGGNCGRSNRWFSVHGKRLRSGTNHDRGDDVIGDRKRSGERQRGIL